MFFATARQKRRWYHHIRPPPDARWTNVNSGRMLYPPPSLPLNDFYLLMFRSIENIFSWRCDSHFQGEMRRGDGATVLSSATIATNSHLQETNWWVGPGWAVEDDGSAGSIMKERRIRWKFKKRAGILSMRIGIFKFKSLNLCVWLYTIGFLIWVRGQFAMATTTYTCSYVIDNIFKRKKRKRNKKNNNILYMCSSWLIV